jgi:hypothetical protein
MLFNFLSNEYNPSALNLELIHDHQLDVFINPNLAGQHKTLRSGSIINNFVFNIIKKFDF